MPKIRLNDRAVASLPCRQDVVRDGRIAYSDEMVNGLILVLYPPSKKRTRWLKSFTFRYESPLRRGKRDRRRLTLGHFRDFHPDGLCCPDCLSVTQARKRVIELTAEVEQDRDPQEPAGTVTVEDPTVDDVAQDYLVHAEKTMATFKLEKYKVNRYLKPATVKPHPDARRVRLFEMPVTAVRPHHVAQVLKPIELNSGLVQRNRVRATLSLIFGRAKNDLLIESNPVRDTPHLKETPRQDPLQDDQLLALWKLLEAVATGESQEARHDPVTPRAFQLALLTLARRREVLMMEWDRIQEPNRPFMRQTNRDVRLIWHLPGRTPDFGRVTKNGYDHFIALGPLGASLIDELRKHRRSDRWVFPGIDPQRPRTSIQWAKTRYTKLAGFHFRFHGLRHTGTDGMADIGIPSKLVSYCAAQNPDSLIERVYIQTKKRYREQTAEAFMRWDAEVRRRLSGKKIGADVVSIEHYTELLR